MPHITEGLLHAYLDGALGPDEQLQWAEAEAHLEACDDCRRRLDEAAELRAAAHDLLAAATPSRPVTRPAFDDLAARARVRARRVEPASGQRTSARAGGAWWRTPATLGWAASLVIAAGAGWIGRQLVVEQGLVVPPVAVEREAPTGGAEIEEGAALDDSREEVTSDEAGSRRDAAATPAAPQTAARLRADGEAEPRQGDRPETEAFQEKAEPRAEPEPGVGADVDADVGAMRVEEVAPLADAAGATGDARCYEAPPPAGDVRDATAGNLETLRLAPDGTASARLGGQPMVGFWERARGDSLRLRVTDGEEWRAFALVEAEDGVRGDAVLDAARCP